MLPARSPRKPKPFVECTNAIQVMFAAAGGRRRPDPNQLPVAYREIAGA